MFPLRPREDPAGSSSHNELNLAEGDVDSKKGGKPSLAERNRERQQRFRQRQKSRIEELEARCQRLANQARALAVEKEDLSKSVSLLKNIVQVRDLQLVAVTTQLAQLANGADSKADVSSQESLGNLEALLQQQPTLQALEALQSRAQLTEAHVVQLQTEATAQAQEGPSSTSTESQEPLTRPIGGGSPASSLRPRSHSPPLALDQLCRVAELEELQQGETSSPVTTCKPEPGTESLPTGPPAPLFAHLTAGFESAADAVILIEGQRVPVHTAMLAAHSNYFFRKLQQTRHSQPLYPHSREMLVLDAGVPGKRIQDLILFLRHCYGVLDLAPVADADVMRLVMLADEFEAPTLLSRCDKAIVARAHGRSFTYFVELSQGGDVVDWIRLADRLGLREVSGVCELHLARYLKENRTWRGNTRLNELGQECLLRVINKLAEL